MERGRGNRAVNIAALAGAVVAAVVLASLISAGPRGGDTPTGAADSPGQRVSSSPDSLPRSEITADDAADLARSHVQDGARLVATVAGKYRDVFVMHPVEPGSLDDVDKLVWAVTYDEQFVICPPNGSPCWTPRPGRTQVILDYYTGEFLESASVAPA
jgi:hypothetical protein